jgi:LysM repeat protein
MVVALEPVLPAIAVNPSTSRRKLILISIGTALLGIAFGVGVQSLFNQSLMTSTNYLSAPLTQPETQTKVQLKQAQKTIQKLQAQVKEKERIYRVKPGDSLAKISKKVYGNLESINLILEANPRLKSNPNEIYAGELLDLSLTKNE